MKKIFFLIIYSLSILFSCDDILEKDIENSDVIIHTPREGLVSEEPLTSFWWEYVDGASYYNLQVASPTFDSDGIEKLVLDTVITDNKFEFTLYPGTFQWCVSAFNNISATDFFCASFKIDSTEKLNDVILSKPLNNACINANSIEFIWQPLPNATSYNFKLFREEVLIYYVFGYESTDIDLPDGTVLDETSLLEGNYRWEVQAFADNTPPSDISSQDFIIDRTPPASPSDLLPNNSEIITESPIVLSWTRIRDDGADIVGDSLLIAINEDFTTDSIVRQVMVADTIFSFTPLDTGNYWWRVKSIDKAGNVSNNWSEKNFTYSGNN